MNEAKKNSQSLEELQELQVHLRELAHEIVSGLPTTDPLQSRELLGAFISELLFSLAERDHREDRRQKQAEGIAAAKARGVRFGRPAPSLPDNFDELHQAWRDGRMTLTEAANICGMPRSTFYSVAVRKEQSA